MRLVIASDTHSLHDQISVPEGDIFLHAGDFMNRGVLAEVSTFSRWIRGLPHRHKIVIAGNHDLAFEDSPEAARRMLRDGEDGLTYLQDSGIAIDGVKFWGSPWQPWFNDWRSICNAARRSARKWNLIPAEYGRARHARAADDHPRFRLRRALGLRRPLEARPRHCAESGTRSVISTRAPGTRNATARSMSTPSICDGRTDL